MVLRGKPDPEPYRRGAELLGFAPGECIVVEDAPSGVGAGVAAGCRVLGVLGTASCGAAARGNVACAVARSGRGDGEGGWAGAAICARGLSAETLFTDKTYFPPIAMRL